MRLTALGRGTYVPVLPSRWAFHSESAILWLNGNSVIFLSTMHINIIVRSLVVVVVVGQGGSSVRWPRAKHFPQP
jgi:uncharacterized membrane protein